MDMDALTLLETAFAPLAGKHILDIGCGAGALAAALSKRGARVAAIDPSVQSLAQAAANVPATAFHQAGAEALPFSNQSFDGAVFLNSLHHVPANAMGDALREAARVVKPDGRVVVIEPLAEGSFYEALLAIENEREVRAAAQACLREAVEQGVFRLAEIIEYRRAEKFRDVEHYLKRVASADPARETIIRERRSSIEASFSRAAERTGDGRFLLDQPMRAHVLRPNADFPSLNS